MAHWNSPPPELESTWGLLCIQPPTSDAPAVEISTPFRVRDLSRLPPGSRAHPIHDYHHAAWLVLDDVLCCLCRNLRRCAAAVTGQHAWLQLHTQRRFFAEMAEHAITERQPDEFRREVTRNIAPGIRVAELVDRIDRDARTQRAQQSLALYYGAALLSHTIERRMHEGGTDPFQIVATVLADLANLQETTDAELTDLNQDLARQLAGYRSGLQLEAALRYRGSPPAATARLRASLSNHPGAVLLLLPEPNAPTHLRSRE